MIICDNKKCKHNKNRICEIDDGLCLYGNYKETSEKKLPITSRQENGKK